MIQPEKKAIATLSDQVASLQAEIKHLDAKLLLATIACLKTSEYHTKYDYLTGLPNRNLICEIIGNLIANKSSHDETNLSVLYLNVDHLTIINETLGFYIGDMVLQAVAMLLKDLVNKDDWVAKLSGDEFVVVLHAFKNINYLREVSLKILDELGKVIVEQQELFISASIGIATYPSDGESALELLKHATVAMRAAKACGKNQYQFFISQLPQYSKDTLLIIRGIRKAVTNHELRLQFQPIIDLQTLKCIGVEALLRWQHPELGLLLPDTFLPYAEELGVTLELGRWVLQQACEDYNKLPGKVPLLLCVNMSATEFMVADLEDFILSCLRRLGIGTERIIIELTEKIVMHDPDYVINKIKALANAGISIAIDDYGMGYSSLNLLKQLPTNLLKIDKSFISDIDKKFPNSAIIESTIQLAHNLGMKVIAEGVETEEEMLFLKSSACDFIQGYFFSNPLFFDDLKAYLIQASLLSD